MTPSDMEPEERIAAIGIVPIAPYLLFDLDTEAGDFGNYGDLRNFAEAEGLAFDVHDTKGGFHLVSRCESWDRVQELIDRARARFPESDSIPSCRKQRLRISPKWDYDGEVSPQPRLLLCRCAGPHRDWKELVKAGEVRREGYWTASA